MTKLEFFDTTLRDGTQGEGISLSVNDKLLIAERLDDFGIDIIEGGWPGSNPKDADFFKKAKLLGLKNAKICAFGSTARQIGKIESDPNLNALLKAETEVVSIFGKTWQLHSKVGLGLTPEENAELIFKSVRFITEQGRRVIYDCEHFFDGYKDDPHFAIQMIQAALSGGADTIVLCDTNGGTLTHDVFGIITKIKPNITAKLGIHAHNDSELAVANSLAAVSAGVTHIQGTINGVGERCGNANLCSILPNILLKQTYQTQTEIKLNQLSDLSGFIYDMMNMTPFPRQAFVGKSAFAHKGGIHVSAVLKNSLMYEHIKPELIGNNQRVLISDLAGQSNIRYKAEKLGINLEDNSELCRKVVDKIKLLEYEGYQYDGADASFELLLRSELGEFNSFFDVLDSRVHVNVNDQGHCVSDATLKVRVGHELEHTASDGNGPVNAMDHALRKALSHFYPQIKSVKLIDYKVRVVDEKKGTAAKVRVLIESSNDTENWITVGVSENIIEASLKALSDSLNYYLYQLKVKNKLDIVLLVQELLD